MAGRVSGRGVGEGVGGGCVGGEAVSDVVVEDKRGASVSFVRSLVLMAGLCCSRCSRCCFSHVDSCSRSKSPSSSSVGMSVSPVETTQTRKSGGPGAERRKCGFGL